MIETAAATIAVTVVIGFCCFAWWDVWKLGKQMQLEQVGAGGSPRASGRVHGGTDGTACADVFPREWVIASSRPFDQDAA